MHADVFHQLANHLKKHRRDTTEVHQRFGAAAPLKHCLTQKPQNTNRTFKKVTTAKNRPLRYN